MGTKLAPSYANMSEILMKNTFTHIQILRVYSGFAFWMTFSASGQVMMKALMLP